MSAVRSNAISFKDLRVTAIGVLFIILSILMLLPPAKADAAWVNAKSFNSTAINKYCQFMASTTIYRPYIQNRDGTVSGWYCMYQRSAGWWIRPGHVCTYNYGGSYRFVQTNHYNPYGGYCAVWR